MPAKPYLSLIVPLYNEAGCLVRNIEIIKAYLDSLEKDYEMVLVNDGSLDNTGVIAKEIASENRRVRFLDIPGNRGKGYAVKTGILNAMGEYVLYTDADLAVPIRFVGVCLKKLEQGAPLVIGSRHLSESSIKVREDPFRQFLGDVYRRATRLGLGLKVSDITCGLKGFHNNAARKIFSRSRIERWGCDAEIIFLGRILGYRISEVPVDWYHSFDSKVKVASACVRTFIEMLQIRYYHLTNTYKQCVHGKNRI